MNNSVAKKRVSICVPTYKREAMLIDLLRNVSLQVISDGVTLSSVAVFDNDADGSAESVVQDAAKDFPCKLLYVPVRMRGLTAVRNAILDYCKNESELEYVAMIDDDEEPIAGWLSELLRVQQLTNADAIIGPVERILPSMAPSWIKTCNAYQLPVFADGTPLRDGYSGNCLIKISTLRRLNLRFDDAFNLAGGEDQFFFRQLLRSGGTMAYAANAHVREYVFIERTKLNFLIRHALRGGSTLTICDKKMYGASVMLLLRAAKGCGLSAIGLIELVGNLILMRRDRALNGCLKGLRGAGMLLAFLGVNVLGYKQTHEARAESAPK